MSCHYVEFSCCGVIIYSVRELTVHSVHLTITIALDFLFVRNDEDTGSERRYGERYEGSKVTAPRKSPSEGFLSVVRVHSVKPD
ncbi:hypothetical protein Y032_0073g742 [Ancylostoma ceylanicum]|uniref:Uncharacterized protein n=1 Tax=Ancylostoma ceylanicum TaxID=53326 RepID=A0A016TWW2_9BILA|nr:hypothetical protein Y032_0073g742 [Ancylostoma ceylanicum]